MKTDCTKCATPMPEPPPPKPGFLSGMKFVATGYKCQFCGHWNDLKRRKGFNEWKAAQLS